MSEGLQGKVALVTGASSGIGRATALALSQMGMKVVVAARREDRLRDLVDAAPAEMLAVHLDVTDERSVAVAVAATLERFGRLDALINNAGLMQSGLIVGADTREWVRMVQTNLLGSMFAVNSALPHLIASKGAVVQVSSTSGRIASLGSAVYAATKFGITAFSESLRQEVTREGVRVIVVQPGFVATELTDHITDPVMRAAAAEIGQSMRPLDPQDVAAAVVYALSQPPHISVNEILVRPTEQVQ